MVGHLQILTILLFVLVHKPLAQTYNAAEKSDTIKLNMVSFTKSVAYRIDSVTILVEYDDFMKSFKPFWKLYQKNVAKGAKKKDPAKRTHLSYIRRAKFLDSIYQRLIVEITTRDTVYIEYASFAAADIGPAYDYVSKVEAGDCIILDQNGNRQLIVLKQYYSHQRGPLNGWGGWLYFILPHNKPFLTKTKWVS